jgi:anti-sigma B factor antagonist
MKTPWSKRRRPQAAPASAGPTLEVEVEPTSYGALVAIAGELDLATVPQVREALGAEVVTSAGAVVVDLAGVEFMDSTGLESLIRLAHELDERGGRFAIACPEGAARLLLDVTGVASELPVFWTREEAEAAVA